ncbi:hypothetical protein MSC49_14890 [Methylosinus sp. C49]|uniref:hypothetical protein n=1 Tax=Methylosinus sp. C49 TaxID=2699395 RepID=UPI0013673093|nr:hypothetical protein [Methylosinus sp. C49]BBU61554.1 hypothetical protein MSC49_14890 [Methylosinus sp. C49]
MNKYVSATIFMLMAVYLLLSMIGEVYRHHEVERLIADRRLVEWGVCYASMPTYLACGVGYAILPVAIVAVSLYRKFDVDIRVSVSMLALFVSAHMLGFVMMND